MYGRRVHVFGAAGSLPAPQAAALETACRRTVGALLLVELDEADSAARDMLCLLTEACHPQRGTTMEHYRFSVKSGFPGPPRARAAGPKLLPPAVRAALLSAAVVAESATKKPPAEEEVVLLC